jgi:hypothetical protein
VRADLDALLTAIYVLVDDFLPVREGPGAPPRISDAELITLAIAQVFLGLPNDRKFLALAPTCSLRRAAERCLSPGVRTSEGGLARPSRTYSGPCCEPSRSTSCVATSVSRTRSPRCVAVSEPRRGRSAFVAEELPGAELVLGGIDDLRQGRDTVAAALVRMAAPRLRDVGLDVPRTGDGGPAGHRLYELLAKDDPATAHSRYNALVARMVSFARAAERAQSAAAGGNPPS